ncbi:uncharacterized protein [Spinacia oleracea]|uniref:Retrotransposon Copia-like N-terminal domain-containing protein n=1 Tax=Spinacia oleracea TaxID=3562 RepID=A0A9R0IT24_SPIOL|nr:uncharacterized protein LOC110794170 [Spinacia oleracea]
MAGDEATPPPPPKRIEPDSPFYLGSQDRPGDFITPTRLRNHNYNERASDIQTALEARRKFGFLDGTITAPISPCTQSDWTAINAMLVSWITNTIDPEVKSQLTKYREPKRLWDHLKPRFSVVNGHRIQQLKSSIARCEQTKSMSVYQYYEKLNALWEDLSNLEPIISCTCCSNCSAAEKHVQKRETAKLHEFLMGLYSPYYSQQRTNILSQDPLPSLDRAYQLVTQDERVRQAKPMVEDNPPEVTAFSVRATPNTEKVRAGTGEVPFCTNCQKQGHDISSCWVLNPCIHCKKHSHASENCYEIVGYPENLKTSGPNRGRGGRSTRGRGRGSRPGNRSPIHTNTAPTHINNAAYVSGQTSNTHTSCAMG